MKPENTCHKTVSGMMALFNQRFLDTAVPSRFPSLLQVSTRTPLPSPCILSGSSSS